MNTKQKITTHSNMDGVKSTMVLDIQWKKLSNSIYQSQLTINADGAIVVSKTNFTMKSNIGISKYTTETTTTIPMTPKPYIIKNKTSTTLVK